MVWCVDCAWSKAFTIYDSYQDMVKLMNKSDSSPAMVVNALDEMRIKHSASAAVIHKLMLIPPLPQSRSCLRRLRRMRRSALP